MKDRIKGFTLVECIIALAILAIATLTMAQIYAGVASMNRNNQLENTSISNQVEFIEKKTNTEATAVYYGLSDTPDANAASAKSPTNPTPSKKPPHSTTSLANNNYIQIEKVGGKSNEKYSFPVDLYVFESRDNNNKGYDDMTGQYKEHFGSNAADKYGKRYKYIAAHNNTPAPSP